MWKINDLPPYFQKVIAGLLIYSVGILSVLLFVAILSGGRISIGDIIKISSKGESEPTENINEQGESEPTENINEQVVTNASPEEIRNKLNAGNVENITLPIGVFPKNIPAITELVNHEDTDELFIIKPLVSYGILSDYDQYKKYIDAIKNRLKSSNGKFKISLSSLSPNKTSEQEVSALENFFNNSTFSDRKMEWLKGRKVFKDDHEPPKDRKEALARIIDIEKNSISLIKDNDRGCIYLLNSTPQFYVWASNKAAIFAIPNVKDQENSFSIFTTNPELVSLFKNYAKENNCQV